MHIFSCNLETLELYHGILIWARSLTFSRKITRTCYADDFLFSLFHLSFCSFLSSEFTNLMISEANPIFVAISVYTVQIHQYGEIYGP
jgi:hypothetical protein